MILKAVSRYPAFVVSMLIRIVVWNRPNFHSSRALSTALDMSLETSGLDQNQIDIFDFYSYVLNATRNENELSHNRTGVSPS